jgi:hemerythrin-like domain-containing protein
MKTIDIIHDEHRAIASVLKALRFVVDQIAAGRMQPDFRLLASMVDYITQVPEKLHHPKEDEYLFRSLNGHSEAAALIAQLEAEHRDGYALSIELLRALIHYHSVGDAGFAAFEDIVRQYVDLNFAHLNKEESELLPLAREKLTTEDWAVIDAAFAQNFDPHAGAEGEFRDLFRRIVAMTPAPQGLGPAN